MPFASSVFLLVFLPAVLLLHAIAPSRLRGPFLLAASIFFYAWGAPQFVFVVIVTTLADFYLVHKMSMSKSTLVRRSYLVLSVGINLSLLIGCKYGGFLATNATAVGQLFGFEARWTSPSFILPLGISFYTFETITYVVDVYRGVHPPLANPWLYQLYIFLFPKMMAGPIVRYREIADQLPGPAGRVPPEVWLSGFARMSLGFGKKVLLANPLSDFADGVYGDPAAGWSGLDPAHVGIGTGWMAAVAFAMQIYFDFSGYSDMAIGIGRMLGFTLPENFDHPFTSASITEFWRRWHMTLGGFMREYLYIPLGGNREGSVFRRSLVLFAVFLVSGLWHGAAWSFILWGALHGAAVLLERAFARVVEATPRPLRVIGTNLFFVVTVVIFRVPDLRRGLGHVASLWGTGTGSASFPVGPERLSVLGFAISFSLLALFHWGRSLSRWAYSEKPSPRDLVPMTLLSTLLFVLSLAHLSGSGFRPFVYFRF